MPKIEIQVETGDGTLVGVSLALVSWNEAKTKMTTHQLTGPIQADDKFIYTSVANLPSRRYNINVMLNGTGLSTEVTVTGVTLVDPPASDWPFKVKTPADRTQIGSSCAFLLGAA